MSVASSLLFFVGMQAPGLLRALTLQPGQRDNAAAEGLAKAGAPLVGGILPFVAPVQQGAEAALLQEGHASGLAFPGEPSSCSDVATQRPLPVSSPGNFAWVHIPKTGTGFVNVLANYACRMKPGTECADPDFWPGYAPRRKYQQQCAAQFAGLPFLKYANWHAPVDADILHKYHGSLITMLRDPIAHKKSWYAHKILNEMAHLHANGGKPMLPTLREWLNRHRGLQVGFLIGFDGFWDLSLTREHLEQAKRRLRESFAFVGLTERWADSVCLFHASFGGGRCKGCEFAKVNTASEAVAAGNRVAWTPTPQEQKILDEYHDELDEELLAEARRLFGARWARHGLSAAKCQACGCAQSSKRSETW